MMIMARRFILLSVIAVALLACGCSVYLDGYNYAPRPAVAEVASTQPQEASPVTAYATVVGVRKDDPQNHIPSSVEVRLRVENNGSHSVTFDTHTLELMNGDLLKFPPPQLDSEPTMNLAPYQSSVLDAKFPFPPGYDYNNADLESLNLRWQIRIDGEPVNMTAQFRRQYTQYYYNPYWGYPPYYGGWYGTRVVVVHRH
jgi:hypothetical protein